jgi:hypothetical protein
MNLNDIDEIAAIANEITKPVPQSARPDLPGYIPPPTCVCGAPVKGKRSLCNKCQWWQRRNNHLKMSETREGEGFLFLCYEESGCYSDCVLTPICVFADEQDALTWVNKMEEHQKKNPYQYGRREYSFNYDTLPLHHVYFTSLKQAKSAGVSSWVYCGNNGPNNFRRCPKCTFWCYFPYHSHSSDGKLTCAQLVKDKKKRRSDE